MSFSAVPPSTNVLNGYNDAGEAANAQIQSEATAKAKKAAKAAAKKASTKATASKTTISPDEIHGIGTSTSAAPLKTHEKVMSQAGIPTAPVDQHPFDPIFMGIVPLLIVIGLIWGFMKIVIYDIRKNPPYGGFSHKHKKHHPGVMKPRIFNSK